MAKKKETPEPPKKKPFPSLRSTKEAIEERKRKNEEMLKETAKRKTKKTGTKKA